MYFVYAHQQCRQYSKYSLFGSHIVVTFMSITPEMFVLETSNLTHVYPMDYSYIHKVIGAYLKYSIFGHSICYTLQFLSIPFRCDGSIFYSCVCQNKLYQWKVLPFVPKVLIALTKSTLFICWCKDYCMMTYWDDMLLWVRSKSSDKMTQRKDLDCN